MLFTADLWKDCNTLHDAYCDSQGVVESWMRTSWKNALDVLCTPIAAARAARLKIDQWTYVATVNTEQRQVRLCAFCQDLSLS